jgi:hypothetical protein
VQEVVVAPSYLIKDAWEFKAYRDLFGLSISNLLEKEDKCIQEETSVFSKILTKK